MTSTTTKPAVRIHAGSPTALLAVVPHLLGFAPETSMVIIGLEARRGAVKLTMRYDLPDPSDQELAAGIAEHAVAVLAGQQLTAAVAVGYGPDDLVRTVAMALRDALAPAGICLAECLRADNGRYWSYTCNDQACCPDEGTPFDTDGGAEAAAMAGAGEQVLAGRAAVAAAIAAVTGTEEEAMRRATRQAVRHVTRTLAGVRESARPGEIRRTIASKGLAAVSGMIGTYRAGGRYSGYYQIAWLAVALTDLRVRDDAWARMDPGHRAAHLRMWTDVVRHAQPGYIAAPASLLAFVAWQDGNGVLANLALDRALSDTPGYSMATLLRQVITAGAPPSMARLPLTPDEVAACYDDMDDDGEDEPAADLREEEEEDGPGGEDDRGDTPARTVTSS